MSLGLQDQKVGTANPYKEIFLQQKEKALLIRSTKPSQRIQKLKKMRHWIRENQNQIREALFLDFKKPAPEVDLTEIYVVLKELNHAISHLSKWARPKKVKTPLSYLGSNSHIHFEPKGVCLIISPWNFPFNLTVGPLVSAIAAGNTAMIKPSELTPNTTRLVEEMIESLFEAPEVAVFSGDVQVAKDLLELPFDHIFFTGSPRVGKIVMAAAAQNLSSVTLELGGKSPAIIHDSANLEDAVEKLVWGKFLNNGQTCIAPDYVLVPEGLKDQIVDKFKKTIERLYGPGEIQASPDYARIVNDGHYQRLTRLIQEATQEGAQILLGGKSDPNDRFIEPTLIGGLTPGSRLTEEEIFGPVLPVLTYKQKEEVIDLINSKPKPLALYTFSRNQKFIDYINHNTSAGSSCVNDNVIQFLQPNLPFGGVNNSGIGKSHGYYGFLAFSNQKSMVTQRTGLTSLKVLYPPYTPKVKKLIQLVLKYF